MNSESLKKCGLRITPHREKILDILEKSDQPIPADRIFIMMKDDDIDINLSTVYRALEALVSKGLAVKLDIGGENKVYYAYNNNVHSHYLVCLGCKSITTIDYCPLEEYEKKLEEEREFSVSGHKLDIYGYCPGCKKKISEQQ
ncbi:MAG TPA: Fur family transcriptional regulator [Clostridia bacterium]|nr:Fur family transcriptional regulator [Clostridia bacterium]